MQVVQRGFTLIELMVAVVIVAILISIAIPGYRAYVMRTQRTDARGALLRLQANEEKFFLQNNVYTDNLGAMGMIAESQHGLYRVEVALTPAGYTATARPITGRGQESDAKCASFTTDQSGHRGATGSATNPDQYCWR